MEFNIGSTLFLLTTFGLVLICYFWIKDLNKDKPEKDWMGL